jgi:hypothetical protein
VIILITLFGLSILCSLFSYAMLSIAYGLLFGVGRPLEHEFTQCQNPGLFI